MKSNTALPQGRLNIPKSIKKRVIAFEITNEDYQILNVIACRFFEGPTRGGKPRKGPSKYVDDLACMALLDQKEQMAWALEPRPSGPLCWPPKIVSPLSRPSAPDDNHSRALQAPCLSPPMEAMK